MDSVFILVGVLTPERPLVTALLSMSHSQLSTLPKASFSKRTNSRPLLQNYKITLLFLGIFIARSLRSVWYYYSIHDFHSH